MAKNPKQVDNEDRRDQTLRVRVSKKERKKLDEGAASEALETSTWVRSVALKAAAKAARKEKR